MLFRWVIFVSILAWSNESRAAPREPNAIAITQFATTFNVEGKKKNFEQIQLHPSSDHASDHSSQTSSFDFSLDFIDKNLTVGHALVQNIRPPGDVREVRVGENDSGHSGRKDWRDYWNQPDADRFSIQLQTVGDRAITAELREALDQNNEPSLAVFIRDTDPAAASDAEKIIAHIVVRARVKTQDLIYSYNDQSGETIAQMTHDQKLGQGLIHLYKKDGDELATRFLTALLVAQSDPSVSQKTHWGYVAGGTTAGFVLGAGLMGWYHAVTLHEAVSAARLGANLSAADRGLTRTDHIQYLTPAEIDRVNSTHFSKVKFLDLATDPGLRTNENFDFVKIARKYSTLTRLRVDLDKLDAKSTQEMRSFEQLQSINLIIHFEDERFYAENFQEQLKIKYPHLEVNITLADKLNKPVNHPDMRGRYHVFRYAELVEMLERNPLELAAVQRAHIEKINQVPLAILDKLFSALTHLRSLDLCPLNDMPADISWPLFSLIQFRLSNLTSLSLPYQSVESPLANQIIAQVIHGGENAPQTYAVGSEAVFTEKNSLVNMPFARFIAHNLQLETLILKTPTGMLEVARTQQIRNFILTLRQTRLPLDIRLINFKESTVL